MGRWVLETFPDPPPPPPLLLVLGEVRMSEPLLLLLVVPDAAAIRIERYVHVHVDKPREIQLMHTKIRLTSNKISNGEYHVINFVQ